MVTNKDLKLESQDEPFVVVVVVVAVVVATMICCVFWHPFHFLRPSSAKDETTTYLVLVVP